MKKLFRYLVYFILLIAIAFFITGLLNTTSIQKGSLKYTTNWQGQFIDINGEKIRYLQQGKGQDILLIHGMPGSIEDWQPIIDSLSKTYRVTAFDRPGHGFSTANNYNYTLKANVAIVNELIRQLELKNVVVVGHSYGGSIATNLATTNNDKIKSYIIVASPLYQFYPETLFKIATTPVIGKGFTTFIANFAASDKIEEGLVHAFVGNREILTDTFLDTRKKIWSQSKVFYTVSKEQVNYASGLKEVSSNYKNIKNKVDILIGDKDRKNTIDDCKRLKNDIPNAEITFLKNTAHYIQFEKTNKLINVILKHSNE